MCGVLILIRASSLVLQGRCRFPKQMKNLLWMAVLGSMMSVSGSMNGQLSRQVCPAAEINSIESTSKRAGVLRTGKTENIEILGQTNHTVTIMAQGPVLGSMDLPSIKTDLSCLPDGVVLTATITRSDEFNGAVLQNVTWLPKISLSLKLLQPSVMLHTIWKIQTTSGKEVTFAQTPPFRVGDFQFV